MKKYLFFLALLFLINYVNAQWQQTSIISVDCIATKGDTIIAGTYGNGVYISKNNGSSWAKMDSGLTNLYVMSLAINGDTLFAGTNNGVFLFKKDSSSWVAVDSGFPINAYVVSLIKSGNNIFAGCDPGGVYLSSNNGSSWNATSLTYGVNTLATSGSNIFALTDNEGVFSSSNNGNSWTAVNKGFADSANVISLAASGTDIFAGISGAGVFRSSNMGNNWYAVNNGLTEAAGDTIVLSLAASGSNIFAGMWRGVFWSNNNGNSWSSTGLSSYAIMALAINGNYIFAGTGGGGVWRLPLPELGIKEINNNASNVAVYPNPVTDNLQIQTTLPIKEIEVADITGRLLYTTTSKIINCSSFAKGVYFITLTTENGKAVKKFVKE
jgi:hypothetical protein